VGPYSPEVLNWRPSEFSSRELPNGGRDVRGRCVVAGVDFRRKWRAARATDASPANLLGF
jgi:hypothetical protein